MNETLITLVNEKGPIRLDRFLCTHLRSDTLSRERVKGLIKQGLVTIDSRVATKPSLTLAMGQTVAVILEETPGSSLAPVPGHVDILYDDPQLIVINKSPDITVHPAPGLAEPTLIEHLLHICPDLGDMEGERPGIVHRIDKGTSGLMVVARTQESSTRLARAFADREVRKKYLAIVAGVPSPPSGSINAPIGRHPSIKTRMAVTAKGGKKALSDYRTLVSDPDSRWSLQEVTIHTGRTHQIRVHMAHLGHPLLGDATYGGPASIGTHPALAARAMLHAFHLAFIHPATGEPMAFTLPPPWDFTRLLLALSRRCQRIVVTGMPGSGKSALSRELAELGLPLFSADQAVKDLYEPQGDGWTFLSQRYGHDFVPDNGPVDKLALFQAMLREPSIRQEVEQAVHPMVFHRYREFLATHEKARAVVAEIPLYFESMNQDDSPAPDLVVGVYCPSDLRRQRSRDRGLDPAVLDTLDSWQWPEAAKINACDLVVDNSGSPEDLARHARNLARILASLRRQRIRALLDRLLAIYKDGN